MAEFVEYQVVWLPRKDGDTKLHPDKRKNFFWALDGQKLSS